MNEQPITNVDYECPRCMMVVKVPIVRNEVVMWVDGHTQHYAHARCYEAPGETEGLDNGGTMVASR